MLGNISFSVSWAVAAALALYIFYQLLYFGQREKHLPPGPPTIPILGNAHQIPAEKFYTKLKEWSQQYGPVFSLKVGRGTIIVLNDRQAVHDIVDKKSANYVDRPLDDQMHISLGGENLAIMHSGPLWRAQRKIASQMLSPRRLDEDIALIQEAEFGQLMYDLLETPENFFKHVRRTTASVSSIVNFGFRAPDYDSFWSSGVFLSMVHISSALELGSYLPTYEFPILNLIPDRWSESKRRAKECYRATTAIWKEARDRVNARRERGIYRDSLIDRMLSEDVKSDTPMTSTQFNNFIGTLHNGASDTTASAILTNIMYLAKHSEFQDKARIELDHVCGTDRMPVWSDFKTIPYINCIVKEGLRIEPVVPTGVPHRAKQDDWYNGMLIPKDATVLIPAWSIHRTLYDDPYAYNPDRYLNHPKLANDYAGSPDYQNRDHYTYGAGRRICVGIHLAERTQWRLLARLLWAFKIEPDTDKKTGEEVEIDTCAYHDGFVHEPAPFKVKFTPRSEKHIDVIRENFRNVEESLGKWE